MKLTSSGGGYIRLSTNATPPELQDLLNSLLLSTNTKQQRDFGRRACGVLLASVFLVSPALGPQQSRRVLEAIFGENSSVSRELIQLINVFTLC